MQGAVSLWQKLDFRRKAIVAGATLAVFVAVLALARVGGSPQMALLYAGLDSAAAGDVVAALEAQGVAYRIEGDSIHVPADKRDGLRMILAAEGLPANAGTGYELLDGLSGFGTTSQMFDAAYWRAKEGELARTILANPAFSSARVHIARMPESPFARDTRPTASVTVVSAVALSGAQAKALRHIVAASVSGMKPEDVAVIDSDRGLVAEDEGSVELAGNTRAAEIRGNVERLLAAHLGPGKAAVEVAVDLVTEREAITERRFDPQGRVAISSETEERSGSSTDAGDAVTVASNLPDGDAAKGDAGQKNSNSESRERVNYQVSETQRELVRVPGSIRRLSVAVLVDGRAAATGEGAAQVQPRSDEELSALRELVASAVGLDEGRGDVLVVKSLAFEGMPVEGTLAEAGMLSPFANLDLVTVLQITVLALVVLVLGLFVIRPVLLRSQRDDLPGVTTPLALPAGGDQQVLTGEIDERGVVPRLHDVSPETTDAPVDPVTRLRRLMQERQAESVEILRGWMEHAEERS